MSFLNALKRALGLAPTPDIRGGVDWTPYQPDGLTTIWLGWLYRAVHSHGDRRSQGEQPHEVDGMTGAPLSDASLLRGGLVVPGYEKAVATAHYPDKWAANLLLREDPKHPEIGEALWRIPRDKWTDLETRNVAELTLRWKEWALEAQKKGWIIVEPPVAYSEKFTSGFGKDKLPYVFHATHLAVEEAKKRIPGTEQARGPVNALTHASQADRDHAARNVKWYYDEFKREAGAGQ